MPEILSDIDLDIAYNHISSGWFPFNAKVFTQIRSRLESGYYETNRKTLAADLKTDFSLFMYCLRELGEMTHARLNDNAEDGAQTSTAFDLAATPLQIVERATLDDLKIIFSRPGETICSHTFETIDAVQTLRLKESMLSASAAEVLAESVDLDPEVAFSCGLLRQLGLTLISWNYPHVYRRAIKSLTPTETLDTKLQAMLGFSPGLLGLTLARRWNLTEDMIGAIEDSPTTSGDLYEETGVGEALAKICRIGEALARASVPDQYPSAISDWNTAEEEIKRHLGSSGVQLIYERAQENCKRYSGIIDVVSEEQEPAESSSTPGTSFFENVHIKNCPEQLRAVLEKLYKKLRPGRVIEGNIRLFLDEVIPNSGFKSGCIYMVEPTRMELAPTLTIGKVSAHKLKAVSLLNLVTHVDPIRTAFSCNTPIKEDAYEPNGERFIFFAGSIGNVRRAGVLYLEITEEAAKRLEANPCTVFKALRQCLMDCLGLK